MANIRIKNLTGTNTNPQGGQYLAIDTSSATQKIDYDVLKSSILAGHETQVSEDLATASSSSSGAAHVFYNPANRQVTVYGHIYNSGTLATSTALYASISAAYRPAARVTGSGVYIYGTTLRAAGIYINTDGTITQTLSSSVTNIFFMASYFV